MTGGTGDDADGLTRSFDVGRVSFGAVNRPSGREVEAQPREWPGMDPRFAHFMLLLEGCRLSRMSSILVGLILKLDVAGSITSKS